MAERVINSQTGEVKDAKLPEMEKHESEMSEKERLDYWRNGLAGKADQIKRLTNIASEANEVSLGIDKVSKDLYSLGFPAGDIIDDLGVVKRCSKSMDVQAGLIGSLIQVAGLVKKKLVQALENEPDGITATERNKLIRKYLPELTDPDNGTKKKAVTKKKTAKTV